MQNKRKTRQLRVLSTLVTLAILAGYAFWVLRVPVTMLRPELSSIKVSTQTVSGDLPWPGYGQAAVGILGSGVVAQNGKQTPVPIASVAKVITSLAVLSKKPLQPGQDGPKITLTASDVALYNAYAAKEGSLTPVNNGEIISEYQMLEAVLLPSANNIADSMAIWAFGSLSAYHDYANEFVKELGMAHTTIADDASGYAPGTTSTTRDLVKLGEAAMKNRVLAEIAGKAQADIPVAGIIYNVNTLLGTSGIVGIKTGNTLQAGGVFLGASKESIGSKPVTVITAIAGAPDLPTALDDTLPLTAGAQKNFDNNKAIVEGDIVGSYRQPWGKTITISASKTVSVLNWKGLGAPVQITIKPITFTAQAGDIVGTVTAQKSLLAGESSVYAVLDGTPTKPPVWWRLLHPLYK
jgi:D-alanyl-D-alanine carboxypeptidase (penicillin-binding protein 5/6)